MSAPSEGRRSYGAGFNSIGSVEFEYESILEKIGFGKTQWVLLLISGLMTITSMATQTSVGIMAIAFQCEFQMDQQQKGIFMAACVTGIVLSTYMWGYISDIFGRRSVLVYGCLITNLLQFVTIFVTNIWIFNLINFIMGISLGGVSATIYAYLSEFNTDKYRAVVINYSTMFVSITAIYVPLTAWWILSADYKVTIFEGFDFRPWRLIIVANMLPGLIGALMMLPFPESPKFLLAQNKEAEAFDAIAWISRFNTGSSIESVLQVTDYKLKPELITEDNILENARGCGIFVAIWRATVPIFQKPHGKYFIISAITVFGLFFSSAGMQIWFPEIVNRISDQTAENSTSVCNMLDVSFSNQLALNANSTDMDQVICDDKISTKTYIDNIIVGLAFLIGFTVQGVLLNPVGRKNVLLVALAISTLSGFLLHFVTNPTGILLLFCLYILMPGLSISNMCGAVVDLVPTNLRGKAVGICLTLGRLGVVVAANLMGLMLQPVCNTTFAMFTISMLACALLASRLPI